MGNMQGTIFFTTNSGARAYGWSESVWLPTATDLPTGLGKLDKLATARAQLLGSGVQIPYLRVSQQNVDGAGGVYRDSQIEEPNYKTTSFTIANLLTKGIAVATPDSIYNPDLPGEATRISTPDEVRVDQPYSGLLCRIEGLSQNFTVRRSYILRGLPDYLVNTLISKPSEMTGAVNWNAAYVKWVKIMLSGDYGVLSLDRSANNPTGGVTAINTVTGQPIFTIPGMAPAAVGDKVRISGNKMLDPDENIFTLNGLWTVQATPAANQYTFLAMTCPINSTILKFGKGQKQSHIIVPINAVYQRRWAERETGVPFDRPCARRKCGRN